MMPSSGGIGSMAKLLYCWRCKMDVPMLDEVEWEQVLPHLAGAVDEIKRYRDAHGVTFAMAKDQVYGKGALDQYHQITGFRETNVNAIWHHRISNFGPPCAMCGRPLRTARAKFCAECGGLRNS
jgi:hypothetical protein